MKISSRLHISFIVFSLLKEEQVFLLFQDDGGEDEIDLVKFGDDDDVGDDGDDGDDGGDGGDDGDDGDNGDNGEDNEFENQIPSSSPIIKSLLLGSVFFQL